MKPFTCSRLASMRVQRLSVMPQCMAKSKVWRPSIDDVDRLSRGEAAKIRGTGSRDIPHRLNAEERPSYESAKKKGYVSVRGNGMRRERKGSPLTNIYRQWCDAKVTLCCVVECDTIGAGTDVLVVDFSTLRRPDTCEMEAAVAQIAVEFSLTQLGPDQRSTEVVPFDVILPVPKIQKPPKVSKTVAAREALRAERAQAASQPQHVELGPISDLTAAIKAATETVGEQGLEVRRLKEQEGRSNKDPLVAAAVQTLMAQKERLQALHALSRDRPTSYNSAQPPLSARAAALAEAFGSDPSPSDSDDSEEEGIDDRQDSPDGSQFPGDMEVESAIDADLSSGTGREQRDTDEAETSPQQKETETLLRYATWQISARPLFFAGNRVTLKEAAGQIMLRVMGLGGKKVSAEK